LDLKVKNSNNNPFPTGAPATTATTIAHLASIPPPPLSPMLHQPPPPLNSGQQQQIGNLQAKINTTREQIQQSERNLKAQEEFLAAKKKLQIDDVLRNRANEKLHALANESRLSLAEMQQLMDKIVQAGSKEAIAVSSWMAE
jgi:hypothetical protein